MAVFLWFFCLFVFTNDVKLITNPIHMYRQTNANTAAIYSSVGASISPGCKASSTSQSAVRLLRHTMFRLMNKMLPGSAVQMDHRSGRSALSSWFLRILACLFNRTITLKDSWHVLTTECRFCMHHSSSGACKLKL